MNCFKKIIRWFFCAPNEPRSVGEAIIWWEIRRIPYNLFIGFVGFVSLILFYIFAEATHKIPDGEDFVEPIMLLFAPIAMNVGYTFGEIVEVVSGSRWTYNEDVEPWSTALLKIGVIFSLFIVLFPSVYWGFYLLLLKFGIAK